jgi:hypothetical protein
MKFWDAIKDHIDNANQAFNKFDANPYFSHVVDWFGDFIMGRHFFNKETNPEGKTVHTINHLWFRREAPHEFAKSHLDKNLLREITYSRHLKVGHRVRLFDNWGPDPTVIDPDPTLGQIGLNQWNDIRLTLVDNLFQDVECQHPIVGDEREDIIIDLCQTLIEISKLDDLHKLRRFVELEYCKPREDDYEAVKWRHRRVRANAKLDAWGLELQDRATGDGRTWTQWLIDKIFV